MQDSADQSDYAEYAGYAEFAEYLTAEGAYHCPVGSIRPFFSTVFLRNLKISTVPASLMVLFFEEICLSS